MRATIVRSINSMSLLPSTTPLIGILKHMCTLVARDTGHNVWLHNIRATTSTTSPTLCKTHREETVQRPVETTPLGVRYDLRIWDGALRPVTSTHNGGFDRAGSRSRCRLAGDFSKSSFGFETNERFAAEPLPAHAQRGLNHPSLNSNRVPPSVENVRRQGTTCF